MKDWGCAGRETGGEIKHAMNDFDFKVRKLFSTQKTGTGTEYRRGAQPMNWEGMAVPCYRVGRRLKDAPSGVAEPQLVFKYAISSSVG